MDKHRRSFLKLMGLTAAGALLPPISEAAPKRELPHGKPNILLILADDMGWGDLRANNPASHIPTECLDRLAAEGIRFTDGHAGSAACSPTRYALMTGQLAFRHPSVAGNVLGGSAPAAIPANRLTLAGMLKQCGYDTACFGKWNLGMNFPRCNPKRPSSCANTDWSGKITEGPLARGFDVYFGIPGSLDMEPAIWVDGDRFVGAATEPYRVEHTGANHVREPSFRDEDCLPTVTEKAVSYLRGRKGTAAPFFLYLPLPSPHAPFALAPDFRGKTDIGPYGDYCYETDVMVGRVLKALDEAGKRENTLVIFASDNGYWKLMKPAELEKRGHYPSGRFRGYKADIYEGGHRAPFLIRWPAAITPEQVCRVPVALNDMMATLADVVGYHLPDTAAEDSISILPLLTDPSGKTYERSDFFYYGYINTVGLRDGDWNLLAYTRGPNIARGDLKVLALYNTEDDPGQEKDLQHQETGVVQLLFRRLKQYVQCGRSAPKREWRMPAAR